MPALGPISFIFMQFLAKNLAKQECIPVGRIPPASVAVLGWGWGGDGGVCLERESLSRGVCLGGLPRGWVGWGCVPGGVSAKGVLSAWGWGVSATPSLRTE